MTAETVRMPSFLHRSICETGRRHYEKYPLLAALAAGNGTGCGSLSLSGAASRVEQWGTVDGSGDDGSPCRLCMAGHAVYPVAAAAVRQTPQVDQRRCLGNHAAALHGSCLFAPYPARLAQVLWGILAGGCFFGSARLVFHPLEHLAHPNVFVGLCLWDCFTGFLLYLSHAKLPFVPVMLLFAANAALFALIHNRDAMERMLSGRDGDTWELPTEIRKSNGKLMGVLCGIGLLLVLCSRPLAKVMRWAWRLLYTAVWYALRWLLSRGSQEQTAELPEDTSEQVMQLQQNGAAGWIRLVIELVLLVAVLVLVIWKRREIGDALLSAWYSLRHWIQRHLRKTTRSSGTTGTRRTATMWRTC